MGSVSQWPTSLPPMCREMFPSGSRAEASIAEAFLQEAGIFLSTGLSGIVKVGRGENCMRRQHKVLCDLRCDDDKNSSPPASPNLPAVSGGYAWWARARPAWDSLSRFSGVCSQCRQCLLSSLQGGSFFVFRPAAFNSSRQLVASPIISDGSAVGRRSSCGLPNGQDEPWQLVLVMLTVGRGGAAKTARSNFPAPTVQKPCV